METSDAIETKARRPGAVTFLAILMIGAGVLFLIVFPFGMRKAAMEGAELTAGQLVQMYGGFILITGFCLINGIGLLRGYWWSWWGALLVGVYLIEGTLIEQVRSDEPPGLALMAAAVVLSLVVIAYFQRAPVLAHFRLSPDGRKRRGLILAVLAVVMAAGLYGLDLMIRK